jgi:hypothetical protein
MGGWLAPGSLQHINAGALKIYANGIGMLKIYFLEYRMFNDRFPKRKITSLQKHPKKASVFLKVRRIKSYLKKNVKLK